MSKQIASAFALVLSAATVAAAQTAPAALARSLQSGALADRYAIAKQALLIPPAQRGESLSLALASELARVRAESHGRDDAMRAGRAVAPRGEEHDGYVSDLVEAVSQWRDPRALEPLIAAAGTGNIAGLAIARFGEAAVPLLVDAARNGHRRERGGVLFTLALLVEGRAADVPPGPIPPTALSPAARAQIVDLTRELLRPASSWSDLLPIATLALATGDPDLRREVELLAQEPGMVAAHGTNDPLHIESTQNALRRALARHAQ